MIGSSKFPDGYGCTRVPFPPSDSLRFAPLAIVLPWRSITSLASNSNSNGNSSSNHSGGNSKFMIMIIMPVIMIIMLTIVTMIVNDNDNENNVKIRRLIHPAVTSILASYLKTMASTILGLAFTFSVVR